jgi:hypothetical protein
LPGERQKGDGYSVEDQFDVIVKVKLGKDSRVEEVIEEQPDERR